MTKKYGCHSDNASREAGYFVQVRKYKSFGFFVYEPEFIHDTMSNDCRYDNRNNDRRCDGFKK